MTRLRFARHWFDEEALTPASMVAFELYPWHSTKITAAMKPEPEVVRRYVWAPIVGLGRPSSSRSGRRGSQCCEIT